MTPSAGPGIRSGTARWKIVVLTTSRSRLPPEAMVSATSGERRSSARSRGPRVRCPCKTPPASSVGPDAGRRTSAPDSNRADQAPEADGAVEVARACFAGAEVVAASNTVSTPTPPKTKLATTSMRAEADEDTVGPPRAAGRPAPSARPRLRRLGAAPARPSGRTGSAPLGAAAASGLGDAASDDGSRHRMTSTSRNETAFRTNATVSPPTPTSSPRGPGRR